MTDSAKDYYNKVKDNFPEEGSYKAYCGKTHILVGTMRSTIRKSKPIDGLWKACKKAKRMAIVRDLFAPYDECGIAFWVYPHDG